MSLLSRLGTIGCLTVFICSAVPTYTLTGTLQMTSGPSDRLGLNGSNLTMLFDITNPSPSNSPDANGTQSAYIGVGQLMFGSNPILLSSSESSFFHSASNAADANSFYFHPVSTDPDRYYVLIALPPNANSTAASAPPLYPDDLAFSAFLIVPGLDAQDVTQESWYVLNSAVFTSEVPEPGSLWISLTCCLGLMANRFIIRKRRSQDRQF